MGDPDETARLFVAVYPPAPVLAAVQDLPRDERGGEGGRGVRWTRPEQWHVTLRFQGSAPVEATRAALSSLRADACTAVVGPAVTVLGRAVILPVAGLDDLADAVAAATADLGEAIGTRPFVGHLTVARLKHTRRCSLVGHPFRVQFPVTEVLLMRSRLDARGATHTLVESVPLQPVG